MLVDLFTVSFVLKVTISSFRVIFVLDVIVWEQQLGAVIVFSCSDSR